MVLFKWVRSNTRRRNLEKTPRGKSHESGKCAQMKGIEVFNPSREGPRYVTPKKAARLCRQGTAFMRPDGKIQFQAVAADLYKRRIEHDDLERSLEARIHRRRNAEGKPIYFWNGKYPNGIFPPGSNVQFRRLWNRRQRPVC